MATPNRGNRQQIDFDADLMAENQRLRAELHQTELDGAEIARRAGGKIEELEAQIRERPDRLKQLDNFCDQCEQAKLLILLLSGALCGLLTYVFLHGAERKNLMGAIGLATTLSFAYAYCSLRWKQFKRRYEWFTITDNRIYRAVQAWWNSFIEMLKM